MTDNSLPTRIIRRFRELSNAITHPLVTTDEEHADIERVRAICTRLGLETRGLWPPD